MQNELGLSLEMSESDNVLGLSLEVSDLNNYYLYVV